MCFFFQIRISLVVATTTAAKRGLNMSFGFCPKSTHVLAQPWTSLPPTLLFEHLGVKGGTTLSEHFCHIVLAVFRQVVPLAHRGSHLETLHS